MVSSPRTVLAHAPPRRFPGATEEPGNLAGLFGPPGFRADASSLVFDPIIAMGCAIRQDRGVLYVTDGASALQFANNDPPPPAKREPRGTWALGRLGRSGRLGVRAEPHAAPGSRSRAGGGAGARGGSAQGEARARRLEAQDGAHPRSKTPFSRDSTTSRKRCSATGHSSPLSSTAR